MGVNIISFVPGCFLFGYSELLHGRCLLPKSAFFDTTSKEVGEMQLPLRTNTLGSSVWFYPSNVGNLGQLARETPPK